MSRNNKNSGRVTVANFIAVIGLVLLAALLFLGYLYAGDNMGLSAIKALGWTLGFTFLLWFLIKAKSAMNELKKWRIVEIILLVVYIALAVLSSGVATRFINIYSKSGDIQQAASNDIATMRDAIQQFKDDSGKALSETVRGLKNAIGSEQGSQLKRFLKDNDIKRLDLTNIDLFQEYWEEAIDSITFNGKNYNEDWQHKLSESSELINGWSVLDTPGAIETVKTLCTDIDATLNSMSEELPLPAIERQADGSHDIVDDYQTEDYDNGTELAKAMEHISPFSPIGIGVLVFIHLLILFNYLVAYRSNKIRPSRNQNATPQNGILLNK